MGITLGLHNLSTLVAEEPRRVWPRIVRAHVDGVLHSEAQAPTVDNVYYKLHLVENLPEPVAYPVPEPLPGVVAVAAVDTPTAVHELLHSIDVSGLDGHDLHETCLANLSALPPPQHQAVLADDDQPGSRIHLFLADDFFGATRVMVLPELLARVGESVPAAGVFVAVPNRHMLIVHLPTDVSLVSALSVMTRMAQGESVEAPGPLSPEVFHLTPDGEATRLTWPGEDGATTMRVEGPIEDCFRRLGLLG